MASMLCSMLQACDGSRTRTAAMTSTRTARPAVPRPSPSGGHRGAAEWARSHSLHPPVRPSPWAESAPSRDLQVTTAARPDRQPAGVCGGPESHRTRLDRTGRISDAGRSGLCRIGRSIRLKDLHQPLPVRIASHETLATALKRRVAAVARRTPATAVSSPFRAECPANMPLAAGAVPEEAQE